MSKQHFRNRHSVYKHGKRWKNHRYSRCYRRRNFYGYECRFEIWGKYNRRWVGFIDSPYIFLDNEKQQDKDFNKVAAFLKEQIKQAIELEEVLNYDDTTRNRKGNRGVKAAHSAIRSAKQYKSRANRPEQIQG